MFNNKILTTLLLFVAVAFLSFLTYGNKKIQDHLNVNSQALVSSKTTYPNIPIETPLPVAKLKVNVKAEQIVVQQLESDNPSFCGNVENDTALIETTSEPLGNKIPLVLIHGIHNKSEGASLFLELIKDFRLFNVLNDYKIYRFEYESDKYPIWCIARSLRNKIDTNIPNKNIVIIGYSMGGLVARSFMNEHDIECEGCKYKGQRAGNIVEKLITLGTPHHGTPLANENPRVATDKVNWNASLGALDLIKWFNDGCYSCAFDPNVPNRSDLRWDNFKDSFGKLWSDDIYINKQENNVWLRSILHTFDANITAYGGVIGTNSDVEKLGSDWGPVLTGVLLKRKGLRNDDHSSLTAAGVLLERVMSKNFISRIASSIAATNFDITYLYNDGFVPISSATFKKPENVDWPSIAKRVTCLGFDHLNMIDGNGNSSTCGKKSLFASIREDLRRPSTPSNPIPLATRSISIEPSSSYNFQNVVLNTAKPASFIIKNDGNMPISISSLGVSGTNANQFLIENLPSIPFDLAVGATRQLTIKFQPTSIGTKQASLTINSNATYAPSNSLSLSGTGYSTTCSYSLPVTMGSFQSNGGTGSFTINAGGSCDWSITNLSSWVKINSPVSGKGTQIIAFSVDQNVSSVFRLATIMIQAGDKSFDYQVTQDGNSAGGRSGCSYTLASQGTSIGASSYEGKLTAFASSNCTWKASSNSSFWLTVSNTSGIGTADIGFKVSANTSSNRRVGVITVEGGSTSQLFTVMQEGAAAGTTCDYTITPENQSFPAVGGADSFTLSTSLNCEWRIVGLPAGWVNLSQMALKGSRIISYTVDPNQSESQRSGAVNIQGQGKTLTLNLTQEGQTVSFPDIDLPNANIQVNDGLLGSTIYQTVLIRNIGGGNLVPTGIWLDSGSTDFRIVSYDDWITPGATGTATVAFTPGSLGTKTATFTIGSNDPDESQFNFTLTGRGVAQTTGGNDFVWMNKTTIPVTEFREAIGAVYQAGIHVITGNSHYRYDPTVNQWQKKALPTFSISSGGAVAINNKLYAIGENFLSDSSRMQIYDLIADTWSLGAKPLVVKGYFSIATVGGKLYTIGGIVNGSASNRVDEYNPATDTWTRKADLPTPRAFAACTVFDSKIFVIGGDTGSGSILNKVEVFDPATNTWSAKEDIPTARRFASAVTYNGKIFVIGGEQYDGTSSNGRSSTNLVEELDPLKVDPNPYPNIYDTWVKKNSTLASRSFFETGVINDKAYLIGGQANNKGSYVSLTTVEEGVFSAAPDINCPVRKIDFGDVLIGGFVEKKITVQNLGNSLLQLAIPTGAQKGEFVLWNAISALDAGKTIELSFRLDPKTVGAKKEIYRIVTNDPDTPTVDIEVSANVIAARSTPEGVWQDTKRIPVTSGASFSTFNVNKGKAYIGRGATGQALISVMDLSNGSVQKELKIPAVTTGFVSPNRIVFTGTKAYIPIRTNSANGIVTVLNTIDDSIMKNISIADEPSEAGLTSNLLAVGKVANFSDGRASIIQLIDTATDTISKTVSSQCAYKELGADPFTNKIYSPKSNNSGFAILDATTGTEVGTLAKFGRVFTVGSKGYLVSDDSITVFDTQNNSTIANTPIRSNYSDVTITSKYLLLSYAGQIRDGKLRGWIDLVSLVSNSIVGSIPIDYTYDSTKPSGLFLATDKESDTVYALNTNDQTIRVIRQISPNFSVTCNPQAVAITNGSSGSANCTITNNDGFSNQVNLACAGLPAGATCTFSGTQVTSSGLGTAIVNLTKAISEADSNGSDNTKVEASANLTITIPGSVLPGVYALRTTGKSGDLTDTSVIGVTIPSCEYQLGSTSGSIGSDGGIANVTVQGTTNCGWSAISSASWITINSGASGTSNGTVAFTVAANNTSAARTGILTIAGQTFSLTQQATASSSITLNLVAGWNLISLPLQPGNTSITTVLTGISGKYDRVFAFNTATGSYVLYNANNPGLSSLFTMEAGRGYWVRMNTAAQLIVTGTPASKTIALEPGWNLVSYPGAAQVPLTDALAPINGKYTRVYAWNSVVGNYERYLVSNPSTSNLFIMEPGRGYFIYVTQKTDWTVP